MYLIEARTQNGDVLRKKGEEGLEALVGLGLELARRRKVADQGVERQLNRRRTIQLFQE
jgi:hypothetical protein